MTSMFSLFVCYTLFSFLLFFSRNIERMAGLLLCAEFVSFALQMQCSVESFCCCCLFRFVLFVGLLFMICKNARVSVIDTFDILLILLSLSSNTLSVCLSVCLSVSLSLSIYIYISSSLSLSPPSPPFALSLGSARNHKINIVPPVRLQGWVGRLEPEVNTVTHARCIPAGPHW